MKKHILIGTAIIAMIVFSVAGCGSRETGTVPSTQSTEETAHIHVGTGNWEKNGTEHWRVCVCGERIEAGVHELDDVWICKTCGSEILDFGDIDVSEYDARGNVLSRKTFSVDGELLNEVRYERDYDENGNILIEKYFDNGVLREEDMYSSNDGGGLSLVSSVYYYEDGGKVLREFDELGEVTSEIEYDADGNVVQK